jgi:hypothetical protein
MARIYQDAQGEKRFVRNPRQEDHYGPLPDTVLQLGFDERTNPVLIADYLAHKNEYALVAGPPVRLEKNGVPVALNPPGPLAAIRAKVFNGLPLSDAERNVLDRLLFRLLADARND